MQTTLHLRSEVRNHGRRQRRGERGSEPLPPRPATEVQPPRLTHPSRLRRPRPRRRRRRQQQPRRQYHLRPLPAAAGRRSAGACPGGDATAARPPRCAALRGIGRRGEGTRRGRRRCPRPGERAAADRRSTGGAGGEPPCRAIHGWPRLAWAAGRE
ncbi:unnamed protein product, partial [Phaeothamnion confervicola]